MTTPSNEVLFEKYKNMETQNKTEHGEIKDILTEIRLEIKEMPKCFVTRLEFKAVSAVIGTVAVALGIVGFFIGK